MKPLSPKLLEMLGELAHWCPGCNRLHIIYINSYCGKSRLQWEWDGDLERPTVQPALHVADECHYALRNGRIEFFSNCCHALAGKTVALPDLPEKFR